MAHIIVVGNEKGGSGKSTIAMHIATALAHLGHRIATLDIDLRQQSYARYLANRVRFMKAEGLSLPTPRHLNLPRIDPETLAPGQNMADQRLKVAIATLEKDHDFILIDCPGHHVRLSQVAHMWADTLVTPLNDSFVDLDLLAQVEADGETIQKPSVYAEMVWQTRQLQAKNGRRPSDWIVLRNREGSQQMVNKKKVGAVLDQLSKRIGFRMSGGFSERVVFRELFPRGLTLLDLREIGVTQLNLSNIAARQELRDLMKALRLPNVEVAF